MSPTAVMVVALWAICAILAMLVFLIREKTAFEDPPAQRWQHDRITPLALGPRNRVAERVARGPILTQAVLVAVEMARADGQVDPEEKDAIRSFILNNVTDADDAFVELVMKEGFGREHTKEEVEKAIETIRAVGSEEQRRLIVQLLAHVAGVDGRISPEEEAFMEQVGGKFGLSSDAVKHLLKVSVR
ncbi:MAG: TerB family tellurite resistance protein [Proteobacteria bacterium]|nr:TerB family tellurite resistance protein [Pseudomonadota bacterium]